MKRFVIAFACMLFALPVFAERVTIDVGGTLTDAQRATLASQATNYVVDNVRGDSKDGLSSTTPQKVKEWAEIGQMLGETMSSTAKQLGVAVNDFSSTKVGTLTMALIVWHYLGAKLIGVTFGTLWLVVTIPVWIWLYRRSRHDTSIAFFEKGEGPKGARKVITKTKVKITDGEGCMFILSLIAIVAIGVITVFASG